MGDMKIVVMMRQYKYKRPPEAQKKLTEEAPSLHEFSISTHIYDKPIGHTEVLEQEGSWPNSDSSLCDQ